MLNKFSDVPLYIQLKNEMVDKINNGEYVENSQIPSEQELCQLYSISRPTVRQAISELTNNGFLYKAKGRGTFVSKRKECIVVKNYSGFTDSILDSLKPENKTIISVTTTTNVEMPELCDVFGIRRDSTAEFAKIGFINQVNNEVLSYNVSIIPLSLFPEIIDDIKLKKSSHEIFRGKYPLVPSKSKTSLDMIFSESCDSAYLHIQPGQPLLRFETTLTSKGGQVVEYIVSKFRIDRCTFSFEGVK